MKNIHLIPAVVEDIADKLSKENNPNVRDTYILRLETIRDYCELTLSKTVRNKITATIKNGKYGK